MHARRVVRAERGRHDPLHPSGNEEFSVLIFETTCSAVGFLQALQKCFKRELKKDDLESEVKRCLAPNSERVMVCFARKVRMRFAF